MDKVLISAMTLAKVEAKFVHVLRDAGFELVYPAKAEQYTEEELLVALKGIRATLAGSEPYTPRVFDAHPQLRVVARSGVGYDAVDLAAATAHGVAVCFTPGTNHDAVAEHTFALMLGLVKRLVSQHLTVMSGAWPRGTNLPLRGRTLGIVSLGRIGKSVAKLALAFGMKVLVYEPFPDMEFVTSQHLELVPLERLLAESDFVTLHPPLTPQTKHLINKKTLALMKPTAYLVNTARGGLVCEADLLETLKSRKIAGAALDVFEVEPPGKNPLFELDNVLVTPHAAGVDLQSRNDVALSAAESIVALSRGEWPADKIVNPEVRERFRW